MTSALDGRVTRGAAQPRGDHRRAARLLRGRASCGRASHEVAARAGRVGAVGAQPLRRRRSAARRGRAAAVGAVRCTVAVPASSSRPRAASTQLVAQRAASLRSGHAGAPRRAAHAATTRRRSRRTSRGSTGGCGVSSKRRSPTSTTTRSTRSTPSLSWDAWNRLRTAQGVQRRARAARAAPHRPTTSLEGSSAMSAIRPNKEQFLELMNAPDDGPVVMLNLLKFKAAGDDGGGDRCVRVRQVQRRRSCRWSKRAAARCCGWARPTRC